MSVGLLWAWFCFLSTARSETTILDEWSDDYSFSEWKTNDVILHRSRAWFARQKNTKHKQQSIWSMSRQFKCSGASVLQLSFSVLYSCDSSPGDGVTVFMDDQPFIDIHERDVTHSIATRSCASSTITNHRASSTIQAQQPFVITFQFQMSAPSSDAYLAVRDIEIKCARVDSMSLASERSLLGVPLPPMSSTSAVDIETSSSSSNEPTVEPTSEPTQHPTVLVVSTQLDIDHDIDIDHLDASEESDVDTLDLSHLVLWWTDTEQIGWKIFIVVGIMCAFIGCIATACLCGYFQGKHGHRKRRRRPRPRPPPQVQDRAKLTMDPSSGQGATYGALFGYPEDDNVMNAINGIYHMSITMDDREDEDEEEEEEYDMQGNDSDDVSRGEDSMQADGAARTGFLLVHDDNHDKSEGVKETRKLTLDVDDDGEDDENDECQVKRIIVRAPSANYNGVQRIGIDTDEDDCDSNADVDMKMEYLPALETTSWQPTSTRMVQLPRAFSAATAPLRRINTNDSHDSSLQYSPPKRRLVSIDTHPHSQPQAPSQSIIALEQTIGRRQFAYANRSLEVPASSCKRIFVDGDHDIDDDQDNVEGTKIEMVTDVVRTSNDTIVSSATTSNGYWLAQHKTSKKRFLQTFQQSSPPLPPSSPSTPPLPQPQPQPQVAPPPHMYNAHSYDPYPHYNQYSYTPFNPDVNADGGLIHVQGKVGRASKTSSLSSSSSSASCTSVDSESSVSTSCPHLDQQDEDEDGHHMCAPPPNVMTSFASPSHKSLGVPKIRHKTKRSASDSSFPTQTATSVTSEPMHNPMDNREYIAMLRRQSNHNFEQLQHAPSPVNDDPDVHVQGPQANTEAHPLRRPSFEENTTTTQTMDTYSDSDFSHTITQSDYREYMPFSAKHRKPSFQHNRKTTGVVQTKIQECDHEDDSDQAHHTVSL